MKKCIKCGSHAFNLYAEGIDQGGLCDVHYWQGRAHRAEALAEQPAQQEPVMWVMPDGKTVDKWALQFYGGQVGKPLYTTPPQRTEQEPVAWMFEDDEDNGHKTFRQTPPSPEAVAYLAKWNRPAWVPLYTSSPAQPGCKETGVCVQTGLACFGQPAQQEPEYIQLRHKEEEDGFSPWGQPLDPKHRLAKWADGVEMRLLYTSPQPAQQGATHERA